MPISPTYPGVYIDELTSSVHTITGVPTSVAAFVGAASRGPTNAPVHCGSFGDFQRTFGGVSSDSPLSYAVYQFYLNGGSDAEVVRLAHSDAVAATLDLGNGVKLAAIGPGTWGDSLLARVDYQTASGPPTGGAAATRYNLAVMDTSTGVLESYLNISTTPSNSQSLDKMLSSSSLVALPAEGAVLNVAPPANATIDPSDPDQNPFSSAHTDRYTQAGGGEPGSALTLDDYQIAGAGQADKTGLYQLYKTDIFNLLCLPGAPSGVLDAAAALCVERRAILLVDPPNDSDPAWTSVANVVSVMTGTTPRSPSTWPRTPRCTSRTCRSPTPRRTASRSRCRRAARWRGSPRGPTSRAACGRRRRAPTRR